MTPRILGLIDEDPFNPNTWSGSSLYFFNSLKSANVLYKVISAKPSPGTQLLYKLLSFQPDMSRWKFRYHLNTGYFNRMSRVAMRQAASLDTEQYNTVLQVGAWYDLTSMTDNVFASYHDGNLATRLASPYGYPNIGRTHINTALAYESQLYRKMDFIFPMSKWLASSFIRDFGVDPGKVHPVGAGINLPMIKPPTHRDPDSRKILFVGRDFKRKGGITLLEAFSSVRKRVRNAELIIVGPDLENLPEGVRCEGFISKLTEAGVKKLLDLYGEACIFVMPSLYEPFGIAFAEAMAHKLPCIGTDNCAMPEIIDDGENGYIVPPNNSVELSLKIINLLENAPLRQEMGEHAYQKYLANYRWEVVTEKITDTIAAGI